MDSEQAEVVAEALGRTFWDTGDGIKVKATRWNPGGYL